VSNFSRIFKIGHVFFINSQRLRQNRKRIMSRIIIKPKNGTIDESVSGKFNGLGSNFNFSPIIHLDGTDGGFLENKKLSEYLTPLEDRKCDRVEIYQRKRIDFILQYLHGNSRILTGLYFIAFSVQFSIINTLILHIGACILLENLLWILVPRFVVIPFKTFFKFCKMPRESLNHGILTWMFGINPTKHLRNKWKRTIVIRRQEDIGDFGKKIKETTPIEVVNIHANNVKGMVGELLKRQGNFVSKIMLLIVVILFFRCKYAVLNVDKIIICFIHAVLYGISYWNGYRIKVVRTSNWVSLCFFLSQYIFGIFIFYNMFNFVMWSILLKICDYLFVKIRNFINRY